MFFSYILSRNIPKIKLNIMIKKGDYNYEKWVPITEYLGITDTEKRDWLINYFQQLEDNSNPQIPKNWEDGFKNEINKI